MDKYTAMVIFGAMVLTIALSAYALYLLAHCQL